MRLQILGVFDLCHFALLKRGCAIQVGLELPEELKNVKTWADGKRILNSGRGDQ